MEMQRRFGQEIQQLKKETPLPYYGVINKDKHFFDQTREGIALGDIDTTLEDIQTMKEKFAFKKHELGRAIDIGEVGPVYGELMYKSLKYFDIELEMFSHAVYLEAEKKGYDLDEREREFHLQKVNELQDKLYGPEIKALSGERQKVMTHFKHLYEQHSEQLNTDEQQLFESFLSKQVKLYGEDIFDDTEEQYERPNYGWKVPREDYVAIMRKALDIFGLDDRSVVVGEYGNISMSTTTKELKIPDSPEYSHRYLLETCGLIEHEITRHINASHNTLKTLGIPVGNYLQLEEGLAMVAQARVASSVEGIDLTPTIHHLTTYIAEHYPYDQTEELIRAYFKLADITGHSAVDRAKRVKRYVSYKLPGASRKDVVYRRGMNFVATYLRTHTEQEVEEFMSNAYIAKVGIEEIFCIDRDMLLEELDIEKNELQQPVPLGRSFYHELLGEGNPTDIGILNAQQTKQQKEIIDLFLQSKPK